MNKEIKERLKSIIFILVFLSITTWYWYGPREELANLAANVYKYNREVSILSSDKIKLNNNYEFKIQNKTNEIQNYELILNNDYFKQRKTNCKLLSNNYLKYQLNSENSNIEERNLSTDSVIYRGVLNPNEIKDFSITIKLDKENLNQDDCFYPVIKTSTYNKI